MPAFYEAMADFKQQLAKGYLQQAYFGLMEYFRDLRAYLDKKHPDCSLTGIYYGYMDMTYFACTPRTLGERNLKVAIVFDYETFGFEVWLSGANRAVQAEYWSLIKEAGWDQYALSADPRREDYILSCSLGADPDFRDLDALTRQIEAGLLAFTRDVEGFFSTRSI